MEVSVSRKCVFNAAHRLYVKDWDNEKNESVFGKCNNLNYHGHNYILLATVTGEVDPITGYVIDTKILKEILFEEIEDRFDHKNLNLDTEEFKTKNPTAENIAIACWDLIHKRIDKHFKLKVCLYETERNFVEYEGK